MMGIDDCRDARQRVLDAAEQLFMQRGYNLISLRDIAGALGIRQASLYHHFPQGKEQIFTVVAERAFARHHAGICHALASSGPSLRTQLLAVAAWFGAQPAMHLSGIMRTDLPALSADHRMQLERAAYTTFLVPLRSAFEDAQRRGELGAYNVGTLAGMFLALMDGLSMGGAHAQSQSRTDMAKELIDIMLDGAHLRMEQAPFDVARHTVAA